MELDWDRELTVGIVGAGPGVTDAWAGPLWQVPRVRLLFHGASAAAEEMARAFGGSAVPTLAALLAAKPDGVVVATPPRDRLKTVMQALRAGCHVITEPLGIVAPDDAERLVEAARDRWRLFHEAHPHALMLADVVQQLEGDAIGGGEQIRVEWWRSTFTQHVLAQLGPAALAIVDRFLSLDQPLAVRAHAAPGREVVLLEHSVDVALDLATGVPMQPAVHVLLHVRGTRGSVQTNLPADRTAPAGECDYRPALETRDETGSRRTERLIRLPTLAMARDDQARRWAAALRGGTDTLPVDLDVWRLAQRLLHAASRSEGNFGARVLIPRDS